MTTERRALTFALCLVPFIVLACLNAGGYRYGASDQAFYLPAVLKALDPELFPRDTPLLEAQTRLTAGEEVIALVARASGLSLPVLFAFLYALSLVIVALGAWLIAARLYRTRWAAVALLAALTLRHAIARSGTNTLEGYFHPRTVVYGLGLLAIAAFLRRRLGAVAGLLILGATVHPTTALWFALWLGLASAVADPAFRKWIVGLAAAGMIVGVWALVAGPLAGRLIVMDEQWRSLLDTKDYLFPLEWPAYAWMVNLGYLPIIAWIYTRRRTLRLVDDRERALVLGSTVLLVIFAGALVAHTIGIALAFQLQPARVFWMFDFLAVAYAVWILAEGGLLRTNTVRRPVLAALVLGAFAVARGAYVIREAERPPVQLTIPDDDWGRTMAWARTTERSSHWLADPLHAVKYGTSVRVAAERDVLVEAVKDAALGMYDRRVAVRTDERIRAVGIFTALSEPRAQELARTYDLDYLVTEQSLALPLAFESGPLRVYRLR